MKKRILIIGGGFGGLSTFYSLQKNGSKYVEITLVDSRETSLEKPSLPEVAFVGKPLNKVQIPLKSVIENRGGKYMNSEVKVVDPRSNYVELNNGERIPYDYLVIATGAIKDYNAIEGFKDYGYSVCDDDHAPKLYERIMNFNGGKIAVGAAKTEWADHPGVKKLSAPCEGPVGEIMFMLDYALRQRAIRSKSTINVFSPGEIFFEDVGPKVHKSLEPVIKAQGINVLTSKVIKKIEKDHVEFEDGTSLESDLTIIIPPYSGIPFVKNSGIGDEKGFIMTDSQMRHENYKNIFAIGDINAMAMPKLGHIAVMQGQVASSAILKDINGEGEVLPFKPEIFCIMNRAGIDATMILSDYLYGGKTDITLNGPIAHMMKWGFDDFYFYTKGHMPPELMQNGLKKFLEFLKK
ncbi:MAG: sulfide-quinone oxidoreductase [Mesoaciditoga sp.]|uniref:NAD(P)/FAD-dependent oxidoreductase n=1 Tax=Athalassotoga sp. TaxID=2022597 RepID=UPI000CB23B6A|nr:MAG: sulfide-quinone oxidoreductase [Mesoaciditoga sp.]